MGPEGIVGFELQTPQVNFYQDNAVSNFNYGHCITYLRSVESLALMTFGLGSIGIAGVFWYGVKETNHHRKIHLLKLPDAYSNFENMIPKGISLIIGLVGCIPIYVVYRKAMQRGYAVV